VLAPKTKREPTARQRCFTRELDRLCSGSSDRPQVLGAEARDDLVGAPHRAADRLGGVVEDVTKARAVSDDAVVLKLVAVAAVGEHGRRDAAGDGPDDAGDADDQGCRLCVHCDRDGERRRGQPSIAGARYDDRERRSSSWPGVSIEELMPPSSHGLEPAA
jgi:hypothetical protein